MWVITDLSAEHHAFYFLVERKEIQEIASERCCQISYGHIVKSLTILKFQYQDCMIDFFRNFAQQSVGNITAGI